MFNISRLQAQEGQSEGLIKSQNHTNEQKMALVANPWFIKAHRNKLISSVEIVEQNMDPIEDEDSDDANIELPDGLAPEEKTPWADIFVLTAGQDWDILLHRLSTGVRIGQFYQEDLWNIYDMKPYDKIKPNYVREWLVEKKQKWLKLMDDRISQAKRHGLI